MLGMCEHDVNPVPGLHIFRLLCHDAVANDNVHQQTARQADSPKDLRAKGHKRL